MPVLLVTYDLNKEPTRRDYNGLLALLKSGTWARLSESSYAIKTNLTPKQLYAKLKPFLDANDHLLVITLKKPLYGFHTTDVVQWVDRHIDEC